MRWYNLPDGCPRSFCKSDLCPFDYRMRKVCLPQPQSERSEPASEAQTLSLDTYVHSNASKRKPWSHKQKRAYQRSLSFMAEAKGRGCQLFWVTLTTVVGDEVNGERIMRHWAELQRRIERKYGYPPLTYLCVQTTEGGGVLHLVVAIKWPTPARIGQYWMSAEWQKIHGAHRVWIERMGKTQKDHRGVSKYLISQYMAGGQGSAFKRLSYSWWRCRLALGKGWQDLKKEYRILKRSGDVFQDCINSWSHLLGGGSCTLCGIEYEIRDRCIQLKTA